MSPRQLRHSFRIALVALCSSSALSCSVLAPDESEQGQDFGAVTSVTVSNQMPAFTAGGQVSVTVTIVRQGSDLPLTLAAVGLPSGVTATFDPPTLSGTVLSSRLMLAAPIDAPAAANVLVQITVSGNNEMLGVAPMGVTVFMPGVAVTLAGSGSGTVTSSPAGINCGTACGGRFAGGSSVTLTAAATSGSVFAGWSGGCSGSSTSCTITINAPQTNVTATFTSTAPGFTLGVSSSLVSVPQGGSATVDVTITRANGYAGAVSLSVAGPPGGLTVSANPPSTTSTTATLSIAATTALGAGNYPISVSGSGAGISGTKSAALKIQVMAVQGGTGNIGFSYAACDPSEVPVWFAVQNGTGAWTRVTPVGNTFTFAMGTTGGIAYTTRSGSDYNTQVIYASGTELTALAVGGPCDGVHARTGTSPLMGSFGVGATGGTWRAAMGGAVAQTPVNTLMPVNFLLENTPRGPVDLIGLQTVPGTNGATTFGRMILRRDVAYTGSIPALNFGAPESFLSVGPMSGTVSLTNVAAGEHTGSSVSLVTSNGSTGPYSSVQDDPRIGPYPSLPDSILQPSDMYVITALASPGPNGYRGALVMRHRAARDTVALGPTLATPTVTTVSSAPYVRMRAQFAVQGAYNSGAVLALEQGGRDIEVSTTTSYLASTPTNWTVEVPDLTSAGYDATWAPRNAASTDWTVTGFGGRFLPFLGATPQDGAIVLLAAVSNGPAAIRSSIPMRR